MPTVVPLLSALALIIACAKLGGWLSNRLGQPAVLGELAMGILLGPSLLDVFGRPYFAEAHTTETLHELAELGVIFLMFVAGLEVRVSDLTGAGRAAVLAGLLGVAVPVGLGTLALLPFGYPWERALFVGIVLAATSVSISAQTLMELGRLRSREGLTLLGAAVVDDVLAVAVLSAFIAIAVGGEGGPWGLVWIIARMLLFLAAAFLAGMWLLPRAARWAERLPVSEGLTSMVIVSTLAFAWASEFLGGVATITGAFIAGVALAGSSVKEEIEKGIHAITYGLFVPVFLVNIGLMANARLLSPADVGLVLVVCLVAIIAKLVGSGLGARLGGMNWQEATRVGTGMISRGEVGLIIAGAGVSSGVIDASVFTVIVVMVLITTLVTPPLLRATFNL
jgi:Kef-type K+ transport system membrane component KefB